MSWCFKPSQPQRIISGLSETFTKTYIVEWTNKAEIRPEEFVRKRRVVGRIYRMKYSWKSHKDRNRHKNRIKRSGQAWLVYVKDINRNIPTTRRWARGDRRECLQDWQNSLWGSGVVVVVGGGEGDVLKHVIERAARYYRYCRKALCEVLAIQHYSYRFIRRFP